MPSRHLIGCIGIGLVVAVAGRMEAAIVAEYASGVTAAAGQAGAADPVSQGWTRQASGSNAWADAYDSGNGGWRILDATSAAALYYERALTPDVAAAMDANGWTLTFTFSMDSSAIQSDGDTSANYFLPPNHGRQSNSGIWIERAGQYRYNLRMAAEADGDLAIYDGTTRHVLTTGGTAEGYDAFTTLVITYDADTDVATMSVGADQFQLASSSSSPASDRLLFGASSTGGTGSGVYNLVQLDVVPEPAAVTLLAAGLGVALSRRRP